MKKCYACGCGRVLLLYRVPTPTRYGIFHFMVARSGNSGEELLRKSASGGDDCSACRAGQGGGRRLTLAGNDLHNGNSRNKFGVGLTGHADGPRKHALGKGMTLVRYTPAKFL